LKYSSVNHTSFRGKEVNSTYRRKSKPIHRENIGSQIDLRLLGKQLQPIIEESLRKCGKANYRKGTILPPPFHCLCGAWIGYPARFELSPRHRLVSLWAALVDLLFARQVGEGKRGPKKKGADLFSSILSWSALLPVFNPPPNDCLYFIAKSLGSSQVPPLQRLTDHLPLTRRYLTLHKFPVAASPVHCHNSPVPQNPGRYPANRTDFQFQHATDNWTRDTPLDRRSCGHEPDLTCPYQKPHPRTMM
jgi:hypothetical protein